MVYILSSPEGPRGILISDISTFHTPQSRAAPENEESTSAGPSDPSSEAPPPRDPDNIIAAADEAASSFPEVLSPEIAMQYAADGFRHQMKCIYDFQLAKVRVNSAEMTADNTRRPWAQRADARARLMEAQGEMLEAHSRAMRVSEAYLQINRRLPLHTEGDDEIRLKTAHRLGLHHLHAQSQLFRLHDQPRELEAFKPEAQRAFEQYLEAVMEVTPILSGMHIPAIHGDFEARTMLQSMQRIRQPDQPAAARETVARIVRQGRRRRQDAAAPIPELGHGHGINRPLMAVALAQLFPHLWLLFKLCIFLYAFTRVDDSWTQIITMVSIALGILLYNVGALETLWARLMAHLHGLLPMHDIDAAPAQQIGGAVAGRGEAAAAAAILGNDPPPIGRDRAATITPEIYAAQLLRRQQEAQNQNRSWLGERVRAIEHSVLLFITSIVPGVGEGHIQARNNEIRARRRAEEERVANEAALAVPLEAENATPQQSSGDGGALASGASVGESSSQAVRRNVAGDGGGDQEEENPQPTRTQPMEAYVEDEFGVVE